MKLSTRQQLIDESKNELKRLRKLAGLDESKNSLNEESNPMPTVAKIRKVQKDLKHIDWWLRGEPGYHIRSRAEVNSYVSSIEKAIADIKKFTLNFYEELQASKKKK